MGLWSSDPVAEAARRDAVSTITHIDFTSATSFDGPH